MHGEVRLAAGGRKIVAPRVSVDPGSLLDLADGDMIIDYNGADYPNVIPHSPLTALKQRIAEGYNGGAWDGLGVVTSLGDADHFGLGYGEAADLGLSEFAGESFDSTTALISFTRYGDANLDGIVNDIDVARFNNGMANGLSGWVNGDFNYDGTINSADGDQLAANYGMSAVAPALAVAVPEPTGMAMVLTAASTVLGRRRRR